MFVPVLGGAYSSYIYIYIYIFYIYIYIYFNIPRFEVHVCSIVALYIWANAVMMVCSVAVCVQLQGGVFKKSELKKLQGPLGPQRGVFLVSDDF